MRAPSIAAHSALHAEHDEFKNRCEALMLGNQWMLGLAEEAKQLHAKVADMKKKRLREDYHCHRRGKETIYRCREACERA